MSTPRPPGGEGPTQDAGRQRDGASSAPDPAPAWVDPNRTKVYTRPKRSIVERLRDDPDAPGAPDAPAGETASEGAPPPPLPAEAPVETPPAAAKKPAPALAAATKVPTADTEAPPPPRPAPRAPVAPSGKRGGGRLALVLTTVIVAGFAAGAAAVWFSGWRPAFLAGSATEEPAPQAGETPSTQPTPQPSPAPPPEVRPAPPAEPPKPPAQAPSPAEIPRNCYTATTEVKAGATGCGFALGPGGALTFKGQTIADRLTAGNAPAQRVVLYPFSPSGRFVVLRACGGAGGGRCTAPRLADTKERKLFELRVAEGFAWVSFSPKEQVSLLGYRQGSSEEIAAVSTADGQTIAPAALNTPRNRYAMLRRDSLRWPSEQSFSVEVKVCPLKRGQVRNTECEQSDDVRYRRRLVKLGR